MVILTQSLEVYMWRNHRDIYPLVLLGHTELITDEIYEAYIEWCKTDEGRQYLKDGKLYDENHPSVVNERSNEQ